MIGRFEKSLIGVALCATILLGAALGMTSTDSIVSEAPTTASIVVGSLEPDLPYTGVGMIQILEDDLLVIAGNDAFAFPWATPHDPGPRIFGDLWLNYEDGVLTLYIANDHEEFEQSYTVEPAAIAPPFDRGTGDCPDNRLCCECVDHCTATCAESDLPTCICNGKRSKCRCIERRKVVIDEME